MRIAITGATGVLGSALTRALIARGDSVVVLSRTPNRLRRLDGLIIETATSDPTGLDKVLAEGPVDVLVQAACSYGRSGENLADLLQINCTEPLRLVLAGSARIGSIIAVGTGLPRVVSPYALSKHQFADWLEHLSGDRIPPATVVELEHFYGPGDDPSKFLTRVAQACLAHQPLELTAGTQLRDFIHIDDAVRGLVTLIDNPTRHFRRIPLGSGEAVTVRSVVERIHVAAASHSPLRFGTISARPREPDRCQADIAALRTLGWAPAIPLTIGISALVASERTTITS